MTIYVSEEELDMSTNEFETEYILNKLKEIKISIKIK